MITIYWKTTGNNDPREAMSFNYGWALVVGIGKNKIIKIVFLQLLRFTNAILY